MENFDLAEQELLTNSLSDIANQEYASRVGKEQSDKYSMALGEFPYLISATLFRNGSGRHVLYNCKFFNLQVIW